MVDGALPGSEWQKLLGHLYEALDFHYRFEDDITLAAHVPIHYDEKQPDRLIKPGISITCEDMPRKRTVFRIWEEDKGPDLICDYLSAELSTIDQRLEIYKRLGACECFFLDPINTKKEERLTGFRLGDNGYRRIPLDVFPGVGRCLQSYQLMLLFCLDGDKLHAYDPTTGDLLRPPRDTLAVPLDLRVREAETRAEQELEARISAERRIAELEALLAQQNEDRN